VSSGSACTSASMEPSFVLKAIGVSNELAYSSVRFSLGATNDEEQIDFAVECVAECVRASKNTHQNYGADASTLSYRRLS
jgi:cysteine desulfurase